MKKIYLFVLLLNFLLLSTVGSSQEFTFNDNEFNDLTGELNGYVMFAQGTVIPAGNHIAGDVQPHLVPKLPSCPKISMNDCYLVASTNIVFYFFFYLY